MLQLILLLSCLKSAGFSARVVDVATKLIGTPYVFGRASTDATDCSGLVQMVYAAVGVALPRTTLEQFQACRLLPAEQVQSGDLVFFGDTYRPGVSHVGIYIGNGKFIHADRNGVKTDLLTQEYYAAHLLGGGRPLAMLLRH